MVKKLNKLAIIVFFIDQVLRTVRCSSRLLGGDVWPGGYGVWPGVVVSGLGGV